METYLSKIAEFWNWPEYWNLWVWLIHWAFLWSLTTRSLSPLDKLVWKPWQVKQRWSPVAMIELIQYCLRMSWLNILSLLKYALTYFILLLFILRNLKDRPMKKKNRECWYIKRCHSHSRVQAKSVSWQGALKCYVHHTRCLFSLFSLGSLLLMYSRQKSA